MFVKTAYFSKFKLSIILAVLSGALPVLAADAAALRAPILFDNSAIYKAEDPILELRKSSTDNCYCGFYVSVNGGYGVRALAGSSSYAIANGGVVYSIAVDEKQYTADLSAGYRLSDFRFELSAGYRDFFKITGTGTDGSTTVNVSVKAAQFMGMLSAYYDLNINDSPFKPYIGVGAGLVHSRINIDATWTGASNGSSSELYSNELTPAGALMAGVSMSVTKNIDLDVGYRFMAIKNTINTNKTVPSAPDFAYNNLFTHEVKAGLRYKF
ncbi:MAG: porin family protein [Rhizobiales bacterium]|nr:outer membrane beta-barrel protein [Hyphomicrobiales bacterium]NRB14148.1 porin family protein [Hyphomicrobiales bacterium]